MIKKLLIVAMLASTLGTVTLSSIASEVIIRVAPPELRVESVPAAREGYLWAPGYWDWRREHHTWVKGSWKRERPGYMYHQPNWEQRDGNWHMQRGNWSRKDRDGDGVPNRVDNQPDNPYRK
jgi:hypothetical protein